MTNFGTSKDPPSKGQGSIHPSRSQTEVRKASKTEEEHAQLIKDESVMRRPNLVKIGASADSIFSMDVLRDLQGINAKPEVLEIIEKRITLLSTLKR